MLVALQLSTFAFQQTDRGGSQHLTHTDHGVTVLHCQATCFGLNVTKGCY